MITELRSQYSALVLCKCFGLSLSGYYRSLSAPVSQWKREEKRLEVEITAAHKRTRETYGSERLKQDLEAHGVEVSLHRVKRIRRKLGITCKQKKKYKATTNSRHNLPVSDNVLNQTFSASRPAQIWLNDITYITTQEGWLYLAGIKDLFTGEIVGYAMGKRMTKALVMKALFRAVSAKRPDKGLIIHSDRGSQYCSHAFSRLLGQFSMKGSMSRSGNCYDNAPMESFWGTLKTELVHHQTYATRQRAEAEIREFIEIFYNRQRIQKRLGYLSPAAFERQYYSNLKEGKTKRFGFHY